MRHPARLGAIATAGLHAAVLAALLTYEPIRATVGAAVPIMVDWIAAPSEPAPSQPARPQRVQKKPVKVPERAPVLSAQPLPAPVPLPEHATVPEPPAPPPGAAAEPAPAAIAVTPPVFNADYLDNPPPAYPALSRRAGEQGRVVLRVLVNSGGRADEVEVRSSSGYARLDDTARETVKHWKFVPAKRGAEPVADWVLIPISFRLQG